MDDAITLTERGWERTADSDEMRIPPTEKIVVATVRFGSRATEPSFWKIV